MIGQHFVAVGILVVLLLGVYFLMYSGWKRRAVRTRVNKLHPKPADFAATHKMTGVYVTTTLAGDWLERVVDQTLGERRSTVIETSADAVFIDRDLGESGKDLHDIYIPGGQLIRTFTTMGMAGKFVAKRQVIVLTWLHGDVLLDTGVYLNQRVESALLLDNISDIILTTPPATNRVASLRKEAPLGISPVPSDTMKNEES